MDDDIRWKVRVSKALFQTQGMCKQATVVRGAAEPPASPGYQILL
jgi:hypothetical protein